MPIQRWLRYSCIIFIFLVLTACAGAWMPITGDDPTPGASPTRGATPGKGVLPTKTPPVVTLPKVATESAAATELAAPTAAPTFDPATWTGLPVIPELSPRAVEILQTGLAMGNNRHAFSKVGDCESQADWFLTDFDHSDTYYSLGKYQDELAPVIQYYAGSFKRQSLAARPGFSAASVMAPIWADKQQCMKDETPLDCEFRLNNKPLVAFVMLGSNDASNPKTFERRIRAILDAAIAQGVLPILGTKADNVEGDHFINAAMARIAAEYGLPLWNYWAAVQDLPDHGLQEDGVHLTFAPPFFDNPDAMQRAWPVRNLNALQMLQKVMEQTQ